MEEVNLQTFVMILCKIFCRNFLYINTFILFLGLKKKKKKKKTFQIFPVVKMTTNHAEIGMVN